MNTQVEGRYPSDPTRIDPNRMRVTLSKFEGEAMLRIDDDRNEQFWMTLTFSVRELLKELIEDEDR